MLKKLFGGNKDFYLELKEEGAQEAAPKAEAPAKAPEQPPEAPEAEAETPAPKGKKTSAKKSKAKAAPTPAPAPVAVATSSQNGKVEPKETEFATKYLVTDYLSRRRPGPSLNTFKSMARQAKKQISG